MTEAKDREIIICYWCGKIKTRTGQWVEPVFEYDTEVYKKINEMCPECKNKEGENGKT